MTAIQDGRNKIVQVTTFTAAGEDAIWVATSGANAWLRELADSIEVISVNTAMCATSSDRVDHECVRLAITIADRTIKQNHQGETL